MKACVIGATGAVGHYIVASLIRKGSQWEKVVVLTRREYTDFAGLEETFDVDKIEREAFPDTGFETKYEEFAGAVEGCDAMFIALGALQSKDGKEKVTLVDYEYVLAAGKLAKIANIPHVAVLTSVGANPNASGHYAKTKGLSEEALKELELDQLHIYRAGALLGRNFANSSGTVVVRNKGLFDKVINSRLFKAIAPTKYTIECSDLGAVMVHNAEVAANQRELGVTVYENTGIRSVAHQLEDS